MFVFLLILILPPWIFPLQDPPIKRQAVHDPRGSKLAMAWPGQRFLVPFDGEDRMWRWGRTAPIVIYGLEGLL